MGVLYAVCFSFSFEDGQEFNEITSSGFRSLIIRNQTFSNTNSWKSLKFPTQGMRQALS